MCEIKRLVVASVLSVATAGPAIGQDAVLRSPAVRRYVGDVLEGNPGYAAARTRVAAETERIGPAGALPDPTVTLGVMAVPTPSFDFATERMTRLPIGVRQSVPFPGKRAAATARARADSMVAGASLSAVETRLVAEAAAAYFELAYAVTAVGVWRRRVDLADQASAVAQTRYETGGAPQTDVLRARLRRADLEAEGWTLDATVARARAHADALRGGAGDPIGSLALVNLEGSRVAEMSAEVLNVDRFIGFLSEANPDLLVASARLTRAERNARVFDVARRPDFTVALETGVRFGGREPFATALIGISIPLWAGRKQIPAAAAAHYDAEALRHQRDDLLARLRGELRGRIVDLEALRMRVVQTASEIVPLARAASASALQRYQVGTLDFSAVLDTQDDVFESQLRLAQLIAEYATARAELAALVGEEWYR